MVGMSWGRVLLGGLLAGLTWTLLSMILLGLVGSDFMAALLDGRVAPGGRVQWFLFGSNLAAGIWATWLYAAIRAHYGPGRKAAVITGLAWWALVSMQSAKWVALGTVPIVTAIAPGVVTLPAIIIAALVGGWCYENYAQRTPRGTLPEATIGSPGPR
jgi:hypothetical protein